MGSLCHCEEKDIPEGLEDLSEYEIGVLKYC